VTKHPGSLVFIPPGSLPVCLFHCLKRSIATRVRLRNHASKRCYFQPQALAQALPPGPVLGQAHRYHVLFMPRLPTSTWVLGCQQPLEFMCLRESSDSADPLISATTIQLTPSSPGQYNLCPHKLKSIRESPKIFARIRETSNMD